MHSVESRALTIWNQSALEMRLSSPWVGRRPRGTHNPTRRRLGRSDILIREPVREVCLNSARQLITRGHGKEQNATQRFRKCLQLLRNVQLEKSVGWTQNPPVLSTLRVQLPLPAPQVRFLLFKELQVSRMCLPAPDVLSRPSNSSKTVVVLVGSNLRWIHKTGF